jgi:pimeloyl-ACP methyl ester carboxylesterase
MDRTRFPQLARIVLAGHSAGGQIVHRYAVLNGIDQALRAAGIGMSYIISSPSSYLYFTKERPTGAADGRFAPYDAAACPGYNLYRYGVENLGRLARYAGNLGSAGLFRRYAARDVTYLLGTADNDPDHPQLDQNCGARAQGSNRLERGRNYIRYERRLAGSDIKLVRRTFEVIGVGHTQSRMFGSKCAAALLFGVAGRTNIGGADCRVPEF